VTDVNASLEPNLELDESLTIFQINTSNRVIFLRAEDSRAG